MPYVPKRVIVEGLVWEPPTLPELPQRPDWRPEHPWVPDEPGIGGGPVLPGRPTLPPDFEWPGLPERPERPPVYDVVDPGDAGGHPDAEDLDLNATRRVAVSDGENTFPAYAVVSGDSAEPRHPSRGLPGSWVTIAYHGAIIWAWSPTLELPERPERPGQGLPRPPGREPK